MKYIIDTDIIDSFFDTKKPKYNIIRAHISNLNSNDYIFISILTLFELYYSLSNAPKDKEQMILKTIEEVKNNFQTLQLNEETGIIYGDLKSKLKFQYEISTKNMKIYNIDLIIASTAIVTNSILICNDDIYTRLAEIDSRLKIQNWLK